MAIYICNGYSDVLQRVPSYTDDFRYIADIHPRNALKVYQLGDKAVQMYKREQAPYCIAGAMTKENGKYKRKNKNMLTRSLIFIDYDDIDKDIDVPYSVHNALKDYAYVLYPTISYTDENPRYRLVVKPSGSMEEPSYKATIKDITEKIGLPYDATSSTFSQLQGLPIKTPKNKHVKIVVNNGEPYPITKPTKKKSNVVYDIHPNAKNNSITMKVVDTLINGYGGQGERNVKATRFIGLLLSRGVNADVKTAYDLAIRANDNTAEPLPMDELDRTFLSITRAEINKRKGVREY